MGHICNECTYVLDSGAMNVQSFLVASDLNVSLGFRRSTVCCRILCPARYLYLVSYACGYLYSVMILLHIEYDGVVCNVIMQHAKRVNSVLCIDFFPFKINGSCLHISSR